MGAALPCRRAPFSDFMVGSNFLCSGSGHGGVDHSKGGDHSGPVPKPHGDHFNDLKLPLLTLCPGKRGGCVELAWGGLPHGGELQAGVCPWPGHTLLW